MDKTKIPKINPYTFVISIFGVLLKIDTLETKNKKERESEVFKNCL